MKKDETVVGHASAGDQQMKVGANCFVLTASRRDEAVSQDSGQSINFRFLICWILVLMRGRRPVEVGIKLGKAIHSSRMMSPRIPIGHVEQIAVLPKRPDFQP